MKEIRESWTTSDNKVFLNRGKAITHQDNLNYEAFISDMWAHHRNRNHVYTIESVPGFLMECEDLFESYFKGEYKMWEKKK